jgi:hypothetical protein
MLRGALIGLTLATATASAQPVQSKEESDDLFGFGEPENGVALDCSDGEAFGCAFATDPLEARTSPFALSTVITPARWRNLAVRDSSHPGITTFALGAARDDAGVFFGGATGWETRGFVEGAATDSLDTGGLETSVPLLFVDAMRVTAGGFGAADRVGTGGTVDVDLIRGGAHHEAAAEIWTSGATHGDELHEPLSYELITLRSADDRAVSVGVTARGPIARIGGARLWYAAGIRPRLSDDSVLRDARGHVDVDQNQMPDVRPDGSLVLQDIEHRTYSDHAYSVPILARLGAERGAHRVEVTALATPSRDTEWRGIGTVDASSFHDRRLVLDGIAAWRGTWSRTRARVIASWHHSRRDQEPRSAAAADAVQVTGELPTATELPDDAVLAASCDDSSPTDLWPTIANCPGIAYQTGGPGPLFGQTDDRWSIVGDVAHRVGSHVLSAGVSAEDGEAVSRSRYTGGEVRYELGDYTDTRRYVEVAEGPDTFPCDSDPATPEQCRTVDEISLRARTRLVAAYVADEWRPRADYAFSGGIRWESMKLGDLATFHDQVSPRLGFAWDPLGGGRSRVFASFGRSYAVMPAATALRYAPLPAMSMFVTDGPNGSFAFVLDTEEHPKDPNLGPVVNEELSGGVELALRGALRFTAWGQARWIRRGIEDAINADGQYVLTNPDPPATRQSQMIAIELATAPGRRFGFRVQYQYARSMGAAPGAYDPTLPNTPYLSEAYDLGGDNSNLHGPLPSDLRHRAAVEATARFSIGAAPFVLGMRAVAWTGPPLNVLGDDLERQYLLPRGAGGRLGLLTVTSVHLAAGLGHGLELVGEVSNVFDQQRATAVSELYTRESDVHPISGGTQEDLVFLRTSSEAGRLVGPLPGYGLPTARQAPLSAAIGVRARF